MNAIRNAAISAFALGFMGGSLMAQSPMPPKYPSALACTSEDNSTHFNVTIKLNDWKFDRQEDYVQTNYDNEALAWNGYLNNGSMMIYIQGQVSPLYSNNNNYTYNEVRYDPYGRIIQKLHTICHSIGIDSQQTASAQETPSNELTAQEIAIRRFKIQLSKLKQACLDGDTYFEGHKLGSDDCNPEIWKFMEGEIDKAEQEQTPDGKLQAQKRATEQQKEHEISMRNAAIQNCKNAAEHVPGTPINSLSGGINDDAECEKIMPGYSELKAKSQAAAQAAALAAKAEAEAQQAARQFNFGAAQLEYQKNPGPLTGKNLEIAKCIANPACFAAFGGTEVAVRDQVGRQQDQMIIEKRKLMLSQALGLATARHDVQRIADIRRELEPVSKGYCTRDGCMIHGIICN